MRAPTRLLASTATALALALALMLTACGDDDEASTDTTAAAAGGDETTTTAAPEAEEDTTTTSAAAGAGATVEVADSSLGEILVSAGRTLYIFMPDNGGPSTCSGTCADNWPALIADGDVSGGDGIDASLLGTAARDDGSEQVTIDGWPLYFFAGDAAPGDTNGQGVGDVWYAVAPDGTPIE